MVLRICLGVVVLAGVGVEEASSEGVMARVCRPLRLFREVHLYFIGGVEVDVVVDEVVGEGWTWPLVGFRKGRGPVTLEVVWWRKSWRMSLCDERSLERGIVMKSRMREWRMDC